MLKDKKVLLIGLGILGGGTSMAKFILSEKAELRITDLRKKELLEKELKKLSKYDISYTIGEHKEEDIDWADVVVCNPAVPYFSKYVEYAKSKNKEVHNDFTLFQKYLIYKNSKSKQVWITGTRGKTTTTSWTNHLLGDRSVIGGNVLGNGLQKICKKKPEVFVLETSNYQLEYPVKEKNFKGPEVSVITNILVDHINRHGTYEEYKRVKHQIFSYNTTAKLFLIKGEKSVKDIKYKNKEFVDVNDWPSGVVKPLLSEVQLKSLIIAINIAMYFGVSKKDINQRIKTLETPKMRQEVVFESKNLAIINDSAATSPDALISAINSHSGATFIIGGTDANLDFEDLVKLIIKNKMLEKGQILFLEGSATEKIITSLRFKTKFKNYQFQTFSDLKLCLQSAIKLKNKKIVFSPGAKSFGLFKNEFDRGDRFDKLIKSLTKKD